MNERIREFAIQSGILDVADRKYMTDAEKFAELIVKECAEFVEQDQGSGEALSRRLKEHFGVES